MGLKSPDIFIQTYFRLTPGRDYQPNPSCEEFCCAHSLCTQMCVSARDDPAQLAYFPFSGKAQAQSLIKNKQHFDSPFLLSKFLWHQWSISSEYTFAFALPPPPVSFCVVGLLGWATETSTVLNLGAQIKIKFDQRLPNRYHKCYFKAKPSLFRKHIQFVYVCNLHSCM